MAPDIENALKWLDSGEPAKNRPHKTPAIAFSEGHAIDYIGQNNPGATAAVEGAAALQRKIDHRQAEKAEVAAIYKRYNDNMKAAGTAPTDILKGMDAGEDIYKLFLMAAAALSRTISEPGFYAAVEKKLLAVYGRGLCEPGALDVEIEQTARRLAMLTAAEGRADDEDDQRRIKTAIISHEALIKKLEEMKRKKPANPHE